MPIIIVVIAEHTCTTAKSLIPTTSAFNREDEIFEMSRKTCAKLG